MPADDSLKRLGGGRWETRDGRFAIEPQSGTWVVVDNEQTDDLGLPLVRGPFGSLTAAREAIENARDAGPAESPLADRLRDAKPGAAAPRPKASGKPAAPKAARPAAPKAGERAEPDEPEPPPEPPPEPKWLRDLQPAARRRARELIERLETFDVAAPDEIARAEIARDQPAIVRLALERSLRDAIASAESPGDAVRAAVKTILSGRDSELDVRWRLVDDRGRRLDELDLSD